MSFPFKLNNNLMIVAACPEKRRTHCPEFISQSLTVLSDDPVPIIEELGWNIHCSTSE